MQRVKISFRPSTPADGPRIASLLAGAGLQPGIRLEHLHWKYWQEREDWPGPRSYVLSNGDEIIAHGGIVPATVVWRSGRLAVIQMIDWAARADAGGAGVSLLKQVGRLVDGLLAIGGSAQTRQLLPHLGFRPHGAAVGYARALHPLQILRNGARVSWRLLPRLVRSAMWRLAAPNTGGSGWRSRPLDPAELGLLASALPQPRSRTAVLVRNEGMLRHALSCPVLPMRIYVIEKDECPRGYFLLALARGQVRIADCWVDSDAAADWHALIQCAVREAMRHPGAAELVTWSSDPLFSECLRETGFHARNVQPIQLLLRSGITLPVQSIRVQMLDTDAAYLDHARAALWA